MKRLAAAAWLCAIVAVPARAADDAPALPCGAGFTTLVTTPLAIVPATAGELGGPSQPRGKIACLDRRLLVPALPLPVR